MLLGYTAIYRVSPVHPLARYPGPFFAKISKIFMVRVVLKGHKHQFYRKLHEKYGDIVRIGASSTRMRHWLSTEARCEQVQMNSHIAIKTASFRSIQCQRVLVRLESAVCTPSREID